MSFWDEVYKLREQGLIPRVWTRDCLRPHLQGKYLPNSITTIPSNGSMTWDGKKFGNYIKRGQDPRAWRVGSGEFQLIVDPSGDASVQDEERQRAKAYAHIARAVEAGDPYPLRGLPYRYDRPFDSVWCCHDEKRE
jgi:hypothetical protein